MPNQKVIITDYEAKQKKRDKMQSKHEEEIIQRQIHMMLHEEPDKWLSADMESEYSELEGGMIREFTIHIL